MIPIISSVLPFLRPWPTSIDHWSAETDNPWIIFIVQLLTLILLLLQSGPVLPVFICLLVPWSDSRILLANSDFQSCKRNKCSDSSPARPLLTSLYLFLSPLDLDHCPRAQYHSSGPSSKTKTCITKARILIIIIFKDRIKISRNHMITSCASLLICRLPHTCK